MGFEQSRLRAAALATNKRLGLPHVHNNRRFAIGHHVKIKHENDAEYNNHCRTVVGTTRSYVHIQLLSHDTSRKILRKRNDKVIRDEDSPY